MVEVLIEEMFGSDGNRSKDYERAVVVDAQVNEANQTTLGSARRSAIKNNLTEPTLLEMSGNATSMIGLCQEGKSSPDALRRSAGVILSDSSPRVSGFSAAVPIRNRTRLPFADAAFCCCSED